MLSIYRGFPWKHCGIYVIVQSLGSFAAAAVAYGIYRDAIVHLNGALLPETGLGFFTQPHPGVGPATAFFNEFVATAILSCSILALGDNADALPGAGMTTFVIGLLIAAVLMAFGYNTGACLCPTRDLGPRHIVYATGYGRITCTAANSW